MKKTTVTDVLKLASDIDHEDFKISLLIAANEYFPDNFARYRALLKLPEGEKQKVVTKMVASKPKQATNGCEACKKEIYADADAIHDAYRSKVLYEKLFELNGVDFKDYTHKSTYSMAKALYNATMGVIRIKK